MRHAPITTLALAVLGLAAAALGLFLVIDALGCEGLDCVMTTVGVVFLVWGALAMLALVSNTVGLVAFLTALACGIFLGLVFVFAGRPAGFIPPLLLALLAGLEREQVVAWYLHRSALTRAPEEVAAVE